MVDDVRFYREEKKIRYRIQDFARSRIRFCNEGKDCFSRKIFQEERIYSKILDLKAEINRKS